MNQSHPSGRRFFVALLPPAEIQAQATAIKEYFRDRYNSKAALRSPPHVTLQPPFEWPMDDLAQVKTCLKAFAARSPQLVMTLSGFAAFAPRVIYIDVQRTPDLLALQTSLSQCVETELGIVDPKSKHRPFKPHLTVAFRDLKPASFRQAWPEFEHRPFEASFEVHHLTLLLHNGQCWTVYEEYELARPTQ